MSQLAPCPVPKGLCRLCVTMHVTCESLRTGPHSPSFGWQSFRYMCKTAVRLIEASRAQRQHQERVIAPGDDGLCNGGVAGTKAGAGPNLARYRAPGVLGGWAAEEEERGRNGVVSASFVAHLESWKGQNQNEKEAVSDKMVGHVSWERISRTIGSMAGSVGSVWTIQRAAGWVVQICNANSLVTAAVIVRPGWSGQLVPSRRLPLVQAERCLRHQLSAIVSIYKLVHVGTDAGVCRGFTVSPVQKVILQSLNYDVRAVAVSNLSDDRCCLLLSGLMPRLLNLPAFSTQRLLRNLILSR
jgi:hypothetical protein